MPAHVLILVENLSVPFDRRVWQESNALVAAGYQVTVICPKGVERDRESDVTIAGVRILRYPLRPAAGGPLTYAREYSSALWHTMRLAIRVRRETTVDVVHACNPPDLLFLVALMLRPAGAQFVFDQHDLVPEMFESRFAGSSRLLYWLTRIMERLTYATADAVIAANESYRAIAIERGKMRHQRVAVVRMAPNVGRLVRRQPEPALRRGRSYLAAYLGVMGHQDGVDYALRALAHLRYEIGREDLQCIFMGAGDAYDEMVALSKQLGLEDIVDFVGWVGDDFIQRCLSTADVCLAPDPLNPYNNASTMIKIVEYMAMARPIVSFDLSETRVSAADSAVYVSGNSLAGYASAIDELLRDAERRERMGLLGRRRLEGELSWDHSQRQLIELYRGVVDGARRRRNGPRR